MTWASAQDVPGTWVFPADIWHRSRLWPLAQEARLHGLDLRAYHPQQGLYVPDIAELLQDPLPASGSASFWQGLTVLVTGAAGSIGSVLAQELAQLPLARLVLLDQAETPLADLMEELVPSPISCQALLLSLSEGRALQRALQAIRPDVVIHAAACKHVPVVEAFPQQAWRHNLAATRRLLRLSHQTGVRHFLMVSTDKAVEPAGIMGASKKLAEEYLTAWAEQHPQGMSISSVRFGNVLDSGGSVLPRFRRQLQREGRLHLTEGEHERYFISTPRACRLLLCTLESGRNGQVAILDMDAPLSVATLAETMAWLWQQQTGHKVELIRQPARPGEKAQEKLATEEELLTAEHEEGLTWVRPTARPLPQVEKEWKTLRELARQGDSAALAQHLMALARHGQPVIP